MAEVWTITQKVDLARSPVSYNSQPDTLMLPGDNQGHTWRIEVLKNGLPVDIEGATITGYFLRSDGNTVMVVGSASGNVATVTLAQECYAYSGGIRAVMRCIKDGAIMALAERAFVVRAAIDDGGIIDPGEVIPSIDDLIAKIDEMEQATEDAEAAATKAVRYDTAQTLTDAQKMQARENIDAGIPEIVKTALLNLVQHVAYTDEYGQNYYNTLYAALYAGQFPRLVAVYAPGEHVVYTDDSLDTLKAYLTVKIIESATDTGTVITDYTLSGALVDGLNTVIVQKGTLATTVQVEAEDFYNVMHWNSASNPEIVFAPGLINNAAYHSESNNTAKLMPYSTTAPRLTLCANRGICPFLDSSDEETEYYPIPIPANATAIHVAWTDTNYKISLQQKKYQGQYIFGWIADSGWQTSGSYEAEIATHATRGKADCIIVFIQKGDNQAIIGDTPTIDIQFI